MMTNVYTILMVMTIMMMMIILGEFYDVFILTDYALIIQILGVNDWLVNREYDWLMNKRDWLMNRRA